MDIELKMTLLEEEFAVCQIPKDSPIPSWILESSWFSVTKTDDEISIVCQFNNQLQKLKCEKSWRCLKVEGPLAFNLVGILSYISGLLAAQQISIFAISTYDTDYILIKNKNLMKALKTLEQGGIDINS